MVFITHLLGMPLHRGQIDYLNQVAKHEYRKYVLVPANRWGKSTLISCLQIWHLFYKFGIPPGNREAWFKSEYRTANIGPHSAMTEPVFKNIDQILTSSFPIRMPDGRIQTNKCLIEWFYLRERTLNTAPYKQFFANNSYIEHRSLGEDKGGSLQGKPYGIITYDEGGRSLHLEEEVDGNIMPRLFDWHGSFHILSTPDQNSPSILFHYQMYQDGLVGLNSTYTQSGTLRDNGFFSPEQIQEQYDLYQDNPMKEQVLEGKFIFGGDNIFEIQSIIDAEDVTLNDGKRRIDGHKYVIGIDTAIGSDEMVYHVLDTTKKPYELVRTIACKGNSKSPQRHFNDLMDLVETYTEPEKYNLNIMLETWNGESVRFYLELPPSVQHRTRCYGSWQPEITKTDNQNQVKKRNKEAKKADLILALQKILASREIKIPSNDQKLTQQLSIYKEKDANIPTDRVMALALACWLAQELEPIQEKVTFLDW